MGKAVLMPCDHSNECPEGGYRSRARSRNVLDRRRLRRLGPALRATPRRSGAPPSGSVTRSPELVPAGYGPARRARDGFDAAVAERGLDGIDVPCGDDARSVQECVEALLRSHPDLTAVTTINEAALPGIQRAPADAGLQAPYDFSITGVAAKAWAEDSHPPLTAADVPALDMGEKAVSRLVERIAAPGGGSACRPPVPVPLPPRGTVQRGGTVPGTHPIPAPARSAPRRDDLCHTRLLRRCPLRPPRHGPALFSVGLIDPKCPPSTVYVAFNPYAGADRTMTVWSLTGSGSTNTGRLRRSTEGADRRGRTSSQGQRPLFCAISVKRGNLLPGGGHWKATPARSSRTDEQRESSKPHSIADAGFGWPWVCRWR